MPIPRVGRLDAKQIRRELADPRALCSLLGFAGKSKPQQGGGLLILCPAHEEKTPSCSVSVGPDGTVRACCFSCGFTGDALHLVALSRKINIRSDFRSVLFEAAQLARVQPTTELPRINIPPKQPTRLPSEKVDEVLRAIIASCPVSHDSQTRAYIMSRPSGRALLEEAERAGWAAWPRDRAGVRLAAKIVYDFGKEILNLADLRMSNTGPVAHHPAYRLLIPFRTPEGRLHTLQRRRLDGRVPRYLFPSGYPALWPYGAEQIQAIGRDTSVVYVEGAFDAIERIAKYRTEKADRLVLGLPGITSWRPEWATIAKGREARIALDNDRAGESAVPRLITDLWQAGASAVHRTRPADGRKDWNSPKASSPRKAP